MAEVQFKDKISIDWNIKYLHRFRYIELVLAKDKYLTYKYRGRDIPQYFNEYQKNVYLLYYSVQTYFKQYLEKSNQIGEKLIKDFDGLDLDKTEYAKLKELETILIDWLFREGVFKTVEMQRDYKTMTDVYETEGI